jgi:hypothetical protein
VTPFAGFKAVDLKNSNNRRGKTKSTTERKQRPSNSSGPGPSRGPSPKHLRNKTARKKRKENPERSSSFVVVKKAQSGVVWCLSLSLAWSCLVLPGLALPSSDLNSSDGNRPLALKLLLVALLVLLLAVLEPRTAVRLQHAVLAAEVAGAEAAVADNALRRVAAVLEAAADLLGPAAADGLREVDRGLAGDGV